MAQSISKLYALVPLLLSVAAVVSMVGCRASDRNMRYDQTRNIFKQLTSVIIAVHGHDPSVLKKGTLHDILTSASQCGYLSQREVEDGFFERDAWGNALRVSYNGTSGADVCVVASAGPTIAHTNGKEEELSLKIIFKHGSEPEVAVYGFPGERIQ